MIGKNNSTLPIGVKSGSLSEIINQEFDLAWHKGSTIKHETLCGSERRMEIVDDGSINYYYNENFFRCDDFKKEHDGLHILFAGCSQTEGVGGNIEDVWPSILLNQMKSDHSGFFNIARSGYGWEMVVHNSMVYFDKYGAPDYMFVLLPNIGRNFKWDAFNKNDYSYVQQYLKESIPDNPWATMSEAEYYESLFRFLIGWRLFMSHCNSLGIKLYWSTWYNEDVVNLSLLNLLDSKFSNFVLLNKDEESHFISNVYANGRKKKKDDLFRRDGHAGTLSNEYWAYKFLESIRRNNENF